MTLTVVERREKGLTCYTCGDKLAVKDGGGQRVSGKGRRHQARRKHFSHTSNRQMPRRRPSALSSEDRPVLGNQSRARDSKGMPQRPLPHRLLLPGSRIGTQGYDEVRPWSSGINLEFEQMRHGYHQYDLLQDSNGPRFDDSATLDRAECELWLDGLSVPPTPSPVPLRSLHHRIPEYGKQAYSRPLQAALPATSGRAQARMWLPGLRPSDWQYVGS